MSRIAKNPIIVPEDIIVNIKKQKIILIKGENKLVKKFHNSVNLDFKKGKIFVTGKLVNKKFFPCIGTTYSIIKNMILGIELGFKKKLNIVGIGYKANLSDKNDILFLNLGFSHVIRYKIPYGIKIFCPSFSEIIISGIDKQLVGCVASIIRSYRKPESYKKGKGIRYLNENVKIKESKKKLK